jgi:hypothetical protein
VLARSIDMTQPQGARERRIGVGVDGSDLSKAALA